MILRRDHIAGGLFVVIGVVVFFFSGNLPWGTMAMPGAGMMPKLVLGLMILFGLILVVRTDDSPPLATIAWNDLAHASSVIAVAAAAIYFYTALGFIVTMTAMMLVLLVAVERRHPLRAAIFSVGVTVGAYVLFSMLLKSPLPQGIIGF